MKTLILLMMILNTSFFTVQAKEKKNGGHDGNGGDSIAIEFTNLAREVLEDIKNDSVKFDEVSAEDFEEAIEQTEIATTDETLLVSNIEKDAVNFPDQKLIKVNRSRWAQLENLYKKRALVLHEYLGIMQIDDSKYQISGQLLRKTSVTSTKMTILKTGNYRLLINDNQNCDVHVEVNTSVNKIFITNINNQRSRTYCPNSTTVELSCKNDKCTNSNMASVQIIDEKGFLWAGNKYIFTGDSEILSATKFTNSATHGFFNVQGRSFTGQSRCAIFTANNTYIYCDNKEYSESVHCPQAQERGEQFIIQKCESQTGKTCRISNHGAQKVAYSWSAGIYNSSLQNYDFPAVNLYCRIDGIIAVPVK